MNDCDSNGKLLTLSPSNIKFAQDSIAMCFQNDKDVNATCEEIVKGNIKVTDFPPIYVRYIEGEYFRYGKTLFSYCLRLISFYFAVFQNFLFFTYLLQISHI